MSGVIVLLPSGFELETASGLGEADLLFLLLSVVASSSSLLLAAEAEALAALALLLVFLAGGMAVVMRSARILVFFPLSVKTRVGLANNQ